MEKEKGLFVLDLIEILKPFVYKRLKEIDFSSQLINQDNINLGDFWTFRFTDGTEVKVSVKTGLC